MIEDTAMTPSTGGIELLVILISTAWELITRADATTLRQVCLTADGLIKDLEHPPSRIRASPQGCTLTTFRRVEWLKVHGCPGPEPRQLIRLLLGLSSGLATVVRLELHKVSDLSAECVAAAAEAMPCLQELTLVDASLDWGPAAAALPPSAPFYAALCSLPHLTNLCGVAPASSADVEGLATLAGLTHLAFRSHSELTLHLHPVSQMTALRSLTLPFATGVHAGTPQLRWLSRLVNLETLHDCPAFTPAVLQALQSCVRLTSLYACDLHGEGWEELGGGMGPGRGPPERGVPEYSLPSVTRLGFSYSGVWAEQMRGLLHMVSFPGLRELDAVLEVVDSKAAAHGVADVAEVVACLPPAALGALALRLQYDEEGWESDGDMEQWVQEAILGVLALEASVSAAGHAASWDVDLECR